jgi:hypothetical protein
MPETAAVYWESKIRIYGFRQKTGLLLCSLIIAADRLHALAELARTGGDDTAFELVSLRPLDHAHMQLCLVMPADVPEYFLEMIQEAAKRERAVSLCLDFSVELISFHGPHFHDRYGIARSVIDVLAEKNIPLLAMECTGTSIGIVVPENCSKKAISILAGTFVVPQFVEK